VRNDGFEAHPRGGNQLVDGVARLPSRGTVHRIGEARPLHHAHHEAYLLVRIRPVALPGEKRDLLVLVQRNGHARAYLDLAQRRDAVARGRDLCQVRLPKDGRRPAPHANGRRLLRKKAIKVGQQVAYRPQTGEPGALRLHRRRPQPVGVCVGRRLVGVLLVVDDRVFHRVGQGIARPELAETYLARIPLGGLHAAEILHVQFAHVPAVRVQGERIAGIGL